MKTKSKFRLFKRNDACKEIPGNAPGASDRPYYFRFIYRGKAYVRCLETLNAIEAQKRARAKYHEIVSAVSTGEYKRLDATKLRQETTATLETLYHTYQGGPAEANAKTRILNINALRQLAGDATHISQLTPALARRWFDTVTTAILALSPGSNQQETIASLKRSANSRWAQARSLFTPRCLAHYQDTGIIANPAHLEAFVKAGNAATYNRIPKKNYHPPTDQTIQATLTAWQEITDRDLFLAIGHELAFGLRLSEMAQAQWHWHIERHGYPVLDGQAIVKNGSGLLRIRALDPYYTTMRTLATARGWWPADLASAGPIITGTDTYRTDGLFRAVSDWLRALGWKTDKTNHALRAYAGSQVAMKYGIYEAQMFLRHSTVKVTEQSYSHFVSAYKPQDLNSLPARWATVPVVTAPADNSTSTKPDVILDVVSELRQTPPDSAKVIAWKLENHRQN